MIFTATGTAGFLLDVPAIDPAPRIPRANVKMTLESGSFAFFGLNQEACPTPGVDMCMGRHAYLVPFMNKDALVVGSESGTLRPGLHEIYIISDGTATVELEIEGLSGKMALEATGSIDAKLDELPRNCPAGSCENVGFGGLMRTNGEKGWVSSVAYARVPPHIDGTGLSNSPTSSDSVVSCVYPSDFHPNASPDPADHPQGCDLVPAEGDLDSGRNFILRAADVLANGYMQMFGSPVAHGPVYAGYVAEQFSPLVQGGAYGAWGMWITQGVSCPSGDLLECRAAP